MTDALVHVAGHLEDALRWVVETLDTCIGRETYQMGGGSVLAARWHHRHSTDIDLFFDEVRYPDMPLEPIFQRLRALEQQGEIGELEIHPTRGFACERGDVPMSFFATRQITPVRISGETVAIAGIGTETTSEILLKKVRARMIRTPSYHPRDAYDFVVAVVEDPQALNQVFDRLTPEEKAILAHDAHQGAVRLADSARIDSPT